MARTLRHWTRWVAIFDTHGDAADPEALEAARDFIKWWKPSRRIHGGDVFDFRWLRRAASDEEKAEAVEADYNAGLDLLRWYKPTDIAWGNHDQRLNDAMDSGQGAMRALAKLMIDGIAEALPPGCNTVPYDKRKGVVQLGDHRVIHGYTSGVYAVRKAALTYGNVLMGHIHRTDQVSIETLDRATGYAVGCLCKLDMPYNAKSIGTLMQDHGWAYGYVTATGKTIVWLARRIDGQWIAPTEMHGHAKV